MNRFFNMDNKFFVFMGRVADLLLLNFLCILCCSKENILNILGNESNMNGHFTILYSEGSSSVASLIYMEHIAVCILVCRIRTVFQL